MKTIETLSVLQDFIIVSEQQKDDMSAGGIILAPSSIDRSLIRRATIEKVGPGLEDKPLNSEITVGKSVLFDIRQSIEIELDAQLFRVIKEKDVVAIL